MPTRIILITAVAVAVLAFAAGLVASSLTDPGRHGTHAVNGENHGRP